MTVSSRPLQISRIPAAPALVPFLDAWRELAAGAPMRSPEWLLGWWESFATPDDALSILLCHEPGGALVGLAPLYLQKPGENGTFRLLGAADNCTHHSDWLAVPGWEARVGTAVARFLLDCGHEWQRLVFEAVNADAEAIHATVNALAENGCLRHQRQVNSCWKIPLPATWEEYLGMLSGSLRKRCRKLQRQFFDSGEIEIRQAETEAELHEGFRLLLRLHGARWGSPSQPLGVFEDRRFRGFHERIARELLACGQLRLAWLERAGRPLAVEYQFFDSDAVYAYQAGIDLAADEYSPGKLTMMAAIQFAIANGCRFFDLLGGDEPYKANWRAVPVACHDLRAWQKRGRGPVEWAAWWGYTGAVRRLKPIVPTRLTDLGLKLSRAGKNAFHFLQRKNR